MLAAGAFSTFRSINGGSVSRTLTRCAPCSVPRGTSLVPRTRRRGCGGTGRSWACSCRSRCSKDCCGRTFRGGPSRWSLAVGLVPTLLWRRTRPLLMVAIAFGTTACAPLLTGGDDPDMYTMVYLLLLAVRAVPVGVRARGGDRAGDHARRGRPLDALRPHRPRRRGRRVRRPVLGLRPGRGAALPGQGADARARPGQAAGTGAAGPRPARHRRPPRLGDGDPRSGRPRHVGVATRTPRPRRCA